MRQAGCTGAMWAITAFVWTIVVSVWAIVTSVWDAQALMRKTKIRKLRPGINMGN